MNLRCTLDGVRGIAAASVFAGHTETSLNYVRTGLWGYGDYPLDLWATEGAVAVFFMITGFLFWDKALKRGIDPRSHLLSRVRRIYPLYILSSLIIFFFMVVLYSKFTLKVHVSS
jgi:peptidoglycan/LPS O-acetylase OafA/YrhL